MSKENDQSSNSCLANIMNSGTIPSGATEIPSPVNEEYFKTFEMGLPKLEEDLTLNISAEDCLTPFKTR